MQIINDLLIGDFSLSFYIEPLPLGWFLRPIINATRGRVGQGAYTATEEGIPTLLDFDNDKNNNNNCYYHYDIKVA